VVLQIFRNYVTSFLDDPLPDCDEPDNGDGGSCHDPHQGRRVQTEVDQVADFRRGDAEVPQAHGDHEDKGTDHRCQGIYVDQEHQASVEGTGHL
jgi:hypothetical protein